MIIQCLHELHRLIVMSTMTTSVYVRFGCRLEQIELYHSSITVRDDLIRLEITGTTPVESFVVNLNLRLKGTVPTVSLVCIGSRAGYYMRNCTVKLRIAHFNKNKT